jgi:hypothetical protein
MTDETLLERDPEQVAQALEHSKAELQASLEELERRARAQLDPRRALAEHAAGALAVAFGIGFVLGVRSG